MSNDSDLHPYASEPYARAFDLEPLYLPNLRTHVLLRPIDGSPPDLFAPPVGCGYFARCPHAMLICQNERPPLFGLDTGHASRCWLQHEDARRSIERLHIAPQPTTSTQSPT